MILKSIRDAVATLHAQGHSIRQISGALGIARNTVRDILRHAKDDPEPAEQRLPLADLQAAFVRAQGNVSRMQDLLATDYQRQVSYSTLTRWVREAGLRTPPERSGVYVFNPGEEMQHDTSPHRITIGDKTVTAQCAGLVLAYSRRLFIQYYPRFGRFEVRQFLLDAVQFMDGACSRCVIDNSSVILASGAGADAVFAPEMVAFARTLGFTFLAHRVGDPDRKGRIERNFFFVETNFLPGRQFDDFADLNAQARHWCQSVANARTKRSLGMTPEMAYVQEKPWLQTLPSVLPLVYDTVERVVDLYGYVSLDSNRYSVPERLIRQSVTVYKYPDRIDVHHRNTQVASHPRVIGQRETRVTNPAHHPTPARQDRQPNLEGEIQRSAPEITAYVRALKQRGQGRGMRVLRRLIELQRTYPADAFMAAVRKAEQYGMYDLGRLEKLILRKVAGSYFAIGDDDA